MIAQEATAAQSIHHTIHHDQSHHTVLAQNLLTDQDPTLHTSPIAPTALENLQRNPLDLLAHSIHTEVSQAMAEEDSLEEEKEEEEDTADTTAILTMAIEAYGMRDITLTWINVLKILIGTFFIKPNHNINIHYFPILSLNF